MEEIKTSESQEPGLYFRYPVESVAIPSTYLHGGKATIFCQLLDAVRPTLPCCKVLRE
jgi:hypothetical protein